MTCHVINIRSRQSPAKLFPINFPLPTARNILNLNYMPTHEPSHEKQIWIKISLSCFVNLFSVADIRSSAVLLESFQSKTQKWLISKRKVEEAAEY